MGWIFQCLSPSFIPLGALPFTSLRSVTVGLGRFGVGLLGLFEPADPEPADAAEGGHADLITVEEQVVRVAGEHSVSS